MENAVNVKALQHRDVHTHSGVNKRKQAVAGSIE